MLNQFSGAEPCGVQNQDQQGSAGNRLFESFFSRSPRAIAGVHHHGKILWIREQLAQTMIALEFKAHKNLGIFKRYVRDVPGSSPLTLCLFLVHEQHEFDSAVDFFCVAAETGGFWLETSVASLAHAAIISEGFSNGNRQAIDF